MMEDELSKAFENVTFITKVMEKTMYSLYETHKAANALKFLKAIEEGIRAKKNETISETVAEVQSE